MIAITASEKEAIRERFPRVHIVRTMKQDSKRHHYYMVEDGAPMKFAWTGACSRQTKGSVNHSQHSKL